MRMRIGFLSKVDVNIAAITEQFAPQAVQVFRSRDELAGGIAGLEVLIAMNQGFRRFTVDAELLSRAEELRLVQHTGVAADITDIAAAAAHGIPVATVPGQNGRSVAETGMYLLLGCAKKGRAAQRLVAQGAMGEIACLELAGKTLCLVGLGRVGKLMVPMARGFGMRVVAVRQDPSKDGGAIDGVARIFPAAALHTALARADFVVLALPLNDRTAGLIDGAALAVLKPGAFLINLSRGGHVDRAALEAALAADALAGYGTDVFWQEPPDPADPLLRDERVFATPHSGGKSVEAISGAAREIHANVLRLANGEPLLNVVNMRDGVADSEKEAAR